MDADVLEEFMRRDMDLVRQILLKLEEQNENRAVRLENELEGFDHDSIIYHIMILSEANFINAIDASGARRPYYIAKSLTWQGHEFLDAIRNDTVWNQVKDEVKEKGGSIPFDLLKALALQVAAKYFGL
jgi:predicted transcriptional regulator